MFNFFKKYLSLIVVNPGFTLLEVMMATLVVSLGMLGVVSLIVQNVQVQYINKNALIASQLAQEGLELVRNVRDQNWIDIANGESVNWKNGSGAGSSNDIVQTGDYAIHYDPEQQFTDILDVDGIDSANLYIYNGFYTHHTGASTPFSRIIEITGEDPLGNWIELKCLVRYKDRNRNFDYTARTVLYNWK